MAVSLAIKAGRLKACVVRDSYGNPKISDPDLADREWDANTDYTDAPQFAPPKPVVVQTLGEDPSASEGMDVGEAAAVEKVWKARMAELKFKETARELIPVSEAREGVRAVLITAKTHLLGIPSRLRQADPTLTGAQLVLIEDTVRAALMELAEKASE